MPGGGKKDNRFTAAYCMVGMTVSKLCTTPPMFCPRGLKVDSDAYISMCRNFDDPFLSPNHPGGFWFQQDGASPHTSDKSTGVLGRLFGKKILQNPSNSPDLCVLDYSTWDQMDKMVQAKKPKTMPELKTAIVQAWAEIDMDEVKRASN
eukprot:GEMP01126025.1.p1 GENE.GEMP01126025.1~~GEMP01126025.1.p1  ORF type:complete len:149 (-),score=33.11 GEMP01126025.1:76-522(-)